MVADPNPSDLLTFHFGQGAVVIFHPHRPDFAFQAFKSQRGMTRIAQPQLMVFFAPVPALVQAVRSRAAKSVPCMWSSLERPERSRFTFRPRFFEQKVEFASPDILTNLFIPLAFQKFLVPLVKLNQFFFAQSFNRSFDFGDAHENKLRQITLGGNIRVGSDFRHLSGTA
jgi:hypothetical protein